MSQEPMIEITLMLIGNCGVGKTAIVNRYVCGTFSPEPPNPTLGLDMKTRHVDIDGKKVNLCLIDTSGNHRYRPVVQSYYGPSDGHVIVYDLSDLDSFYSIRHWLGEIQAFDRWDSRAEPLLVGNKSDRRRRVPYDQAMAYGESKNVQSYIETSAKDGHNITEAIHGLVKRLMVKRGHIKADAGRGSCHCL